MNTLRFFGFAAIPSLALVLAACSPSQAGPGAPSQIVVATPDQTGITVTGRGEANAPPDVAFFDVGVEVDARKVGAARNDAAKAAERVIASLKKNGVNERDIQTSSLNVAPRYEYANGRDRIVGYVVSSSVTVKARELDRLGQVIDGAVEAGGNATRVQGIRFGFDDPEKLRDTARERAIGDAKRRASEIARLAGISLAGPLTVEEIQTSAALPPILAEATQDARTPIERGTGTLALEVRVRWAIKT